MSHLTLQDRITIQSKLNQGGKNSRSIIYAGFTELMQTTWTSFKLIQMSPLRRWILLKELKAVR